MKRNLTLLFFLLNYMYSMPSFSQSYPAFNITAYDSLQSNGYYFFCPYKLSAYPTFPAGSQYQMILDKDGRVVFYREVAGFFAGDFKLQPNGQISFCGDGKFYLMDSTFTVVDSVTTGNNIDFDIHDLQILPNGHYLILGNEDVTRNLSSYHIFLGNGTAGSSNATVRAFVVQELDTAKNVVFEWHSIDHFAFDDVDNYWLTDVSNVDWTHVNSVEVDYDGNLLVSSRHFDEITKINRADSSIVWRLGGKRNDFNFVNDSAMFLSQHDARRLSNGNLTLFDNGRATTPIHFASSKEYQLDEVNMTATLVWSHSEGPGHWSRSQGNTQRLHNGNTLTSYGNLVPTPTVFNVVDSLQNKVFEVVFPDSQITYRSFNFPFIPWQLNRPQISCAGDSTQFFLVADSGYAQYRWSTGETTQSIAIQSTGNYAVFVPIGDGGFISSETFTVIDSLDPCNSVSAFEPAPQDRFTLYPNPASGYLVAESEGSQALNYEIIDITGRVVMSNVAVRNGKNVIDVSSLPAGFYLIRMGTQQKLFIKN
jgi:hypothetical protein